MDGEPAQSEERRMKKPAPPKLSKAELVREATKLLQAGFEHPAEAVTWLLNQFTGWDLEAIIERLKNENNSRGRHEDHTGKA